MALQTNTHKADQVMQRNLSGITNKDKAPYGDKYRLSPYGALVVNKYCTAYTLQRLKY